MTLSLPKTPIIIDIGSAYVKTGFAGEPEPRFVFPCITGTEKYQSVMVDVSAKTRNVYVGKDANRMRGVLKITYPVQRGAIMDWNAFYEILNHIFYTLLRVENLSEYSVIYAEHPYVLKETREYIARVLFETHRVKSLMMIPSPLLSIFSVGLTTGMVIESGDGLTWVVPVINGQIFYPTVQKLNLGGVDVNHNLRTLLMREGINIESSAAEEILKEIKEKNCFFVLDANNPPESTESLTYPMPDGSVKEIPNSSLYDAPEVMFTPAMLGYNIMNIPQAIIHSLQLTNNEYWGALLSHIVLSGGNLSYSGLEERLRMELIPLISELGSIPETRPPSISENGTNKLKKIEGTEKKQDNCPGCGALVNFSEGEDTCPSCGASMIIPQLSLDLGKDKNEKKDQTSANKCPYCNKELKDKGSIFCPYCGKTLNFSETMGKIPFAQEFFDSSEDSERIIKFYVPDNLQYAIFNGASVLGSLPSFQGYFITYEQFQADPALLSRDISPIFY